VYLNVDLGELPGEPEELYALAHVANIACGGHAGDRASIRHALICCRAYGARVGAHPSYPDRAGFGRTTMAMSPGDLRASVREQCQHLATEAFALGMQVASVKAHGALYHAANADLAIAGAVVDGATDALGASVSLLGASHGALEVVARDAGLTFAREGFADRGTLADGSLVPRGQPGALIVDPVAAAARARELSASGRFDTVCVHGDTPGAVAIARAVRRALDTP
jgi:5-oxoprolinase (ATP-hydrolysing) subunit A